MEAIGKIYFQNESNTKQSFLNDEDMFLGDGTIIIFYSYEKTGSYVDVLNRAYNYGLKQLMLTPSKFTKTINELLKLNFAPKTIEFDPPLEVEDQNAFNEILNTELQNSNRLATDINFFNDEFNSIPKKLTFYSDKGNKYALFNNGIIAVEEKEEIAEIAPLLKTLKEKYA